MKMLVVDDSAFMRKAIVKTVKGVHPEWVIDQAGDGEQAITMMKAGFYDIASIDFNMPGINGGEVIKFIKAFSPKTKVALVTANKQQAVKEGAAKSNATFIGKPDFKSDLIEFVTGAVASE